MAEEISKGHGPAITGKLVCVRAWVATTMAAFPASEWRDEGRTSIYERGIIIIETDSGGVTPQSSASLKKGGGWTASSRGAELVGQLVKLPSVARTRKVTRHVRAHITDLPQERFYSRTIRLIVVRFRLTTYRVRPATQKLPEGQIGSGLLDQEWKSSLWISDAGPCEFSREQHSNHQFNPCWDRTEGRRESIEVGCGRAAVPYSEPAS